MKTIVFSLLISLSAPALAADLSTYLDQQLTMMEKGGEKELPTPKLDSEKESTFFLKRFWLRIRPRAVFTLPGLVSIQVIPEVEMLWERATPAGWTGYKK